MRLWLAGLALAGCSFQPHAAPLDGTGSNAPADGPPDAPADATQLAAVTPCGLDAVHYTLSYNGHRYWYDTANKDYDHQIASCAASGAHSAVIEDSNENAFIHGVVGTGTAWFGLDDLVIEGSFVWATHVALAVPQKNWSSGEPNNSGSDEDCAYMAPDGTWNDTNCGDNFRGGFCECESDYTPPPVPACMSSTAGTIVNGRRYIVHATPASWTDAELDCASTGAYLFVPSDDNEDDIVQDGSKLALDGVEIWIGLDANPPPYHWINSATNPYTKWDSGEPSGDSSKTCVALKNNGEWENRACSDSEAYVCECDPNPPSAAGF
jgi:hypothetical protein